MDKIAEIRNTVATQPRAEIGHRQVITMSLDDARYLLSELERVQQERDEAVNNWDRMIDKWDEVMQERDYNNGAFIELDMKARKFTQERDKAIEGLKWYAKVDSILFTGEKARTILKELGVNE